MKKMVSIWTWVGLVILVYGVIELGCGLNYAIHPTAASERFHNPCLWWGAVMLFCGVLFTLGGARAGRATEE
jgi:hypothetical protein